MLHGQAGANFRRQAGGFCAENQIITRLISRRKTASLAFGGKGKQALYIGLLGIQKRLPIGVAFDAGVNSGPARGAKWLQQAVGVTADGTVGPATLMAAKSTYAPAAVMRAVGFRKSFLMQLPTWERYKKGWLARLASIEKVAGEMAGHDIPVRPDVEPVAPQPAAVWWWTAFWKIVYQFTKKWRT